MGGDWEGPVHALQMWEVVKEKKLINTTSQKTQNVFSKFIIFC